MSEQMLYRPEEAAAALSLSRARTYELIRSGELRSLKIGRSRRVTREDLAVFVEAQRKAAAI